MPKPAEENATKVAKATLAVMGHVSSAGIRRLGELFVLLSIPFVLAVIGYGWFWEIRVREARFDEERRLRGVLTSWGNEAVPGAAFRRLLQAANAEMKRPGASLGQRRKILQNLHRRFPGLFIFTVLDSQGAPIPELCDQMRPRVIWQRFFAAYQKMLQGDASAIQRSAGLVRTLLGAFIPVGRPLSGTLLRSDPDRQRRWLFVGEPHAKGWFIAHVASVRDWFALPLEDRVKRWNRRNTDTRFCVLHGAPPDFSRAELASSPVRTLWESLEPVVWQDDTLWGLCRVGPRLSLLAARQTTLARDLRREGITVLLGLLCVWLLTLGIGLHPRCAATLAESSIYFRLIVAVGVAAALPFITIGVMTRVFVQEHGQKLEGDLFFRMENALRDLDDLAPVLTEQRAAAFLRRAISFSWPPGKPDLWEENLRQLRPIAPWDLAKIYGPGGRTWLTNASFSSLIWSPDDLGLFDQAALQYLKRLRVKDPQGDPNEKHRPLSFMESTVANMAEHRMGQLCEYSAGEERLFLQFIPLMEGERVTSLLLLTWNRRRLERDFLRRHLLRFARDLPDTRLLVWNPDVPDRWFPKQSDAWRDLRSLFPAIRDQSGCFQGIIRRYGQTALVTAIRSDSFPGSFLVAITSNRFIRAELQQAISRVIGVGLLLGFGSALAGLIFAQSFLRPISALGQGIEALRSHDFSIRLERSGNDELGQLIVAFNRMTEGLKDLQVAQRVQETLYPVNELQACPFILRGKSPGNTAIGGQAFDYSPVNEQEAAFLIGTCRAPGVTAGFGLALVKGVLAHPRTSADPKEALIELEKVIVPILGAGVPLEIAYGRLDRVHCTVRFACRGMMPPLWCGKGAPRFFVDPENLLPRAIFESGVREFPRGTSLVWLTGGPPAESEPRTIAEEIMGPLVESFLRPLSPGEPEERPEAGARPLKEAEWTFLQIEHYLSEKQEAKG